MAQAKSRAAISLLYYSGTPADLKGYLGLMAAKSYVNVPMRKLLVDSLSHRPDWLANPATITTLGAIMADHDGADARMAAAHALGVARSPAARDLLGTSPLFTDSVITNDQKLWVLGYLDQQPAPYSPQTVAMLKYLAGQQDKNLANKAKALLKKTHA
jgi:hypothetical protein